VFVVGDEAERRAPVLTVFAAGDFSGYEFTQLVQCNSSPSDGCWSSAARRSSKAFRSSRGSSANRWMTSRFFWSKIAFDLGEQFERSQLVASFDFHSILVYAGDLDELFRQPTRSTRRSYRLVTGV
jgi:hypothetical protein